MENNNLDNQHGGQNQKTIFSPEEFSLQCYDKHIRQARKAKFAVSILLLVNLLVLFFVISEDYEYLWFDIILWGICIAAFTMPGFWTKKKSYYTVIAAFCLYTFFIVFNAALDVIPIIPVCSPKPFAIGIIPSKIST